MGKTCTCKLKLLIPSWKKMNTAALSRKKICLRNYRGDYQSLSDRKEDHKPESSLRVRPALERFPGKLSSELILNMLQLRNRVVGHWHSNYQVTRKGEFYMWTGPANLQPTTILNPTLNPTLHHFFFTQICVKLRDDSVNERRWNSKKKRQDSQNVKSIVVIRYIVCWFVFAEKEKIFNQPEIQRSLLYLLLDFSMRRGRIQHFNMSKKLNKNVKLYLLQPKKGL